MNKNLTNLLSKYNFLYNRKDMEINSLNSKLEDEQSLVAQLQKKIKELNVRIKSFVNYINP